MKLDYVKPVIEIVAMLPEEDLANSYWLGSYHKTESYWGSPNCNQAVDSYWGSPNCHQG